MIEISVLLKIVGISGVVFGSVGFLSGYDLGKAKGVKMFIRRQQTEYQQQQMREFMENSGGGQNGQ